MIMEEFRVDINKKSHKNLHFCAIIVQAKRDKNPRIRDLGMAREKALCLLS